MARRRVAAVLLTTFVLVSGCVPEVDKVFSQKRLNRLAIPRDDITPGTLVIHKDGIAQSTDNILEVAPQATLSLTSFEAILPGVDSSRLIDASVALKVVDAVLPLGFDGALKLTSSVKIPQASTAGLRVSETQLRQLLAAPAGAPLKDWVLQRALRKIGTFVVMQTYKAKEFSMVAESGKDVTADLAIGATKLIEKAGAKFKITRTSKEVLSISGDKFYVVAVSVAAFDVQQKGKQITLGALGVDLSQPIPKVPVLGTDPTALEKLYRPVGLNPGSDK